MCATLRIAPLLVALAVGLGGCGAHDVSGVDATGDAASLAVAKVPNWRVVDLGAPPAQLQFGFTAMHISNLGLSVGQARINGSTSAVAVTPTGTYTQLRAVSGDLVSLPYSVNALGVAVGTSSTDRQYQSRLAVFWNRDGVPEVVPGLTRSDAEEAITINDLGVMAGYTRHLDPVGSGFVWHKSWPAPRKLENLAPGLFATPVDINIAGQVAGYAEHPTDGSVAVIWDLQGKATVIGRPAGYSFVFPGAINDLGTVAGFAFSSDETFSRGAWTWSRRTGFVTLAPPTGFADPYAYGIDNAGRVYGAAVASDGSIVPVIWVGGRPSSIPSIDGGSVGSGGIYAVSQTGIMSGTKLVNGISHPTIWVPRP